jgi:S-adenosylmethionine synthetase
MRKSTVVVINGEISEELQRKIDEVVKEAISEVGEENVEKIGFPIPPKK